LEACGCHAETVTGLGGTFATIAQLADALEQSPSDDAARAGQRQAIDDALAQLDRSEGRLLEVRASVGGRLNTLEDVQASQESVQFSLEKLVSDVRDLDFAEAVSRLQQELFTLQASQQAFTRIQGNSLFNYI
ncbi:MAG: flagellin, partial [Haliea sp.]